MLTPPPLHDNHRHKARSSAYGSFEDNRKDNGTNRMSFPRGRASSYDTNHVSRHTLDESNECSYQPLSNGAQVQRSRLFLHRNVERNQLAQCVQSTRSEEGSPMISSERSEEGYEWDEERMSTRLVKRSELQKTGYAVGEVILNLVITLINSIMCIPCLYGYASVIFIHPAFSPHIASLSKLVLFSSVIHQICFSLFSTLPFAIGQVQDAGLIFLSSMASSIADKILQESNGENMDEVIVSTTIVLLGIATATLGIVLVILGRFRLADAVSYLPMPVVGGYLAFIGYFCLEAGIALSISKPMVGINGWLYLFDRQDIILALPCIISALILAWIGRKVRHESALPAAMMVIPIVFYIMVFLNGSSLEDARNYGWIGSQSPPVYASDVFDMIKFHKVRWDLISCIIPTWAGMVFVVSFSSCLDVAAISMDMGEALDTNSELMTVGISNVLSGIFCGFTGSYIFSQTIFTYRSGAKSRWIGWLLAVAELSVFVCSVNVLEVSPLFFLGAVLSFIGVDLLYEWLFEIRHKLIMSEYIVLLITFIAINIVGMDWGISVGILVAIVDFVVATAQHSSLSQSFKRSKAVWSAERRKILESHAYRESAPRILSFDLKGSIFFGTSLQLVTQLSHSIGISNLNENDRENMILNSPRYLPGKVSRKPKAPPIGIHSPHLKFSPDSLKNKPLLASFDFHKDRPSPEFVVLDLSHVTFIDASAARGCFLQLVKMCANRNICLAASGASPRVDWILRSHEVAYAQEEEEEMRRVDVRDGQKVKHEKLMLFETVYDALEYCECMLIDKTEVLNQTSTERLCDMILPHKRDLSFTALTKNTLPLVLSHFLGMEEKDMFLLDGFSTVNFHREVEIHAGSNIFAKGDHANEFYIILSGSVGLIDPLKYSKKTSPKIVSGAGIVKLSKLDKRSDTNRTLSSGIILKVGSVFGFVDFILEQSRTFDAVCAENNTVIAIISRAGLRSLKDKDPSLETIVNKVLLQASILELNNVRVP